MAKRELQGQAPSRDERFAQQVAHLLQPEDMKTEHYQYGVEAVDGHQAWALFCASGPAIWRGSRQCWPSIPNLFAPPMRWATGRCIGRR